MDTTAHSFGSLLRRFRSRARVSQETLADESRLSVETISALERGSRRSPYRETVAMLADALALSPAERATLELAARRTRKKTAVRPSIRNIDDEGANLPVALTSFVGREPDIDAIIALLQTARLVTLTGPGGVGKTRLALEVASRLAQTFRDGAWWVDLESLTDPQLIAHAIARALRSRLPAQGDPQRALFDLLEQRNLLLVLDNCEHLIAPVRTDIRALLLACPQLRVLATSRQVLAVGGEMTYRIAPLRLPDRETAARLSPGAALENEALKLFIERARSARADFALTEQTVPIVADICRRLDGIPFAIELAAARVSFLNPSDLRARLDQRFRIFNDGSVALPRRQTLRALIDWSYDLLDECERELFRRVSIFAEGYFTLEAAHAVCGDPNDDELDVLEVLASLVDKSLVLAGGTDERTRYRLFESTRLYALEKLAAHGERERIEVRHAAYFSSLVIAAEQAYESHGSDAGYDGLVPDLPNVRVALSNAAASAGDCGSLAVAAARLFSRAGLKLEGMHWLESALQSVRPDDARLQSRIWGSIAYLSGNTGGARSFDAAARSVELARSAGDSELIAWSLMQYAAAAVDTGARASAESALAEAQVLLGPDPPPHQRAHVLDVQLHDACVFGDLEPALRISAELLELYLRIGSEAGALRTATNHAEILHALGDTEAAIALVRKTMSRSSADRSVHGTLLTNLTAYSAAAGHVRAALETGIEALEVVQTMGRGPTAMAIGHLALGHALAGDVQRAARLFGYWVTSSNALGVKHEFTERVTHERLTVLLAQHLNPADRAGLLEAGSRFSLSEAIAEARSVAAARP
ncbi:MAG: helix-turn-helix domain-containing protein [Candidatus Velthaea sp.]|jgi:non-specific serine/threonine protein kinase